MFRYILRRIGMLIPILFLVSVVVFLMLRLAKGDPAMAYLRLSNIPPTTEALEEARYLLGLDLPVWEQYLRWIGKALQGDFGVSWVTGNPVLGEILYYLPATLKLTAAALFLTLALSIPLGVLAALRKDGPIDHVTRAFAFVGVSMPSFWFAYLLIFVFAVTFKLLPPMGMGGVSHIIMPAMALALMSTAINIRFLRANMLENMHARSVLYARARGLSERRVIWGHVFRNSLVPVVTSIGMHLGELIGGAVVVEMVFAWPGVGRYAVMAIYNRDFPILQCFLLVMTSIFVLCNLLVDILYAWIDPRIRLQGDRS
ncbi:ABC-type transporter, integral membrane subunit [Alkalidesulfovibrio alkalitolerans DSM 16529]|jgi:nickel transport system permease protein|uniref:ABC-type transporter, integral membrane subunit n=1 Tax=Alkalidesulfovibrio alkalitolerans DSM 16529 TaxID=1121439 RepID=S7UKK9_9BACT|nr:nickel ABC transporter permease subunit NikB [Alkalidesulfovibrio alkalitolerans]EPR34374.1 ABC-type transporter, integral membrane subunit [Alkalidesulfovibrio alkalitolerans DSM 16529]